MMMLGIVLFLFSGCFASVDSVNIRLHDTMHNKDKAAFDCFDAIHVFKSSGLTHRFVPTYENHYYCRWPASTNNQLVSSNENENIVNGIPLSFKYLREMNISARELFEWYAPIDVIEEYESGNETGWFVNCSNQGTVWFGSKCEYAYDSDIDPINFILGRLQERYEIPDNIFSITNGTCYEMNGNGCQSILCLDWREICDGKIDCANGLDEYHCDALEHNQCDPMTEFRCLNGLCIDKLFYFDDDFDCMDGSDEMQTQNYDCSAQITYSCEDRSCYRSQFSCGDGYCYNGPSTINGCPKYPRNVLYLKQMPPSTFILFGHIVLTYKNNTPESICFNETMCPYLAKSQNMTSLFGHHALTCRIFNTFTNQTYDNFDDMVKDVKRLVYSCSLIYFPHASGNQSALFQCHDNITSISYHRLSDGTCDCANGEDEHQQNTCLLKLPNRYRCDSGMRCIHTSAIDNKIWNCNDGSDEGNIHRYSCMDTASDTCRIYRHEPLHFNVTFGHICNGIVESTPDMDKNTDESNCIMTEWYHNASHTKCNGAWNLPDGRDEIGCNSFLYQNRGCNDTQHICFDPHTGHPKCLPISKANDGFINCLGSADEREFCRIHYQDNLMRRYRCQNSDLCISPSQVCDCHQDCPENDDETTACIWLNNGREPDCKHGLFRCRGGSKINLVLRCNGRFNCPDGEDEIFCELIDRTLVESINLVEFLSYPEQRPETIVASQVARSRSFFDDSILWHCNRGVHIRSSINPPGFYCFCQDQYYGDRCQFQRRRLIFILQLQTMGLFDHADPLLSFFKVVILLVRNGYNGSIISHEQIIYKPLFNCLPRYIIYLLYPINESSLLYNHSVFVHVFTFHTLEHLISWNFSVPFEFLPVNRIAKRLIVPETVNVSETMRITFKNSHCLSCSNGSLCLGQDIQLNRAICVCPAGRIGRRCLVPFDPCIHVTCNGHGRCIPADKSGTGKFKIFECLCDSEWVGELCESRAPRIHISFTSGIPIPSSKIAFIHTFTQRFLAVPSHLVYFRRLHRDTSNFTFFVKNSEDLPMPGIVFIQLYEHRDQFEYYLLFLCTTYPCYKNEINTKVQSSNRCRHIRELLNATVLAQRPLQRVKNYQRLCLEQLHDRKRLMCFYDDQLMCLCNKINHTDCLNFKTTKHGCSLSTCSGQGMCVQDHELCPTISVCLCDPCSYGNICQFSMAGYTLSLDGIVGSYILPTETSILRQSSVVKWTIVFICLLIVFGLILNGLSTGTFVQKSVRKSGCDRYLLVSSLIGLINMIILLCKIIFLFSQKQNNVSCSLIEFLLKWCPASCEWLNASVGIERTVAVKRKTRFQTATSKRVAKWVIIAVFILVGLACAPELVFRRIVIDTQDNQAWCVLTINADRPSFLTVYSTLNVSLFLLPIISNFITTVIIIIGTLLSKRQATAKPTANQITTGNVLFAEIKKQILKHKHILIAPAVLGLLALPRLIFAFIFVCNKVERRPLLILLSYLIGFLPSMSVLFAFILPSKTYKEGLLVILKRILPQGIFNQIFTR